MKLIDFFNFFYTNDIFKLHKNKFVITYNAIINYENVNKVVSFYEKNLPFLKQLKKYVFFIIIDKIISINYDIRLNSNILFINSNKDDKNIFQKYLNIEFLQPSSEKYYDIIIFNNPINILKDFEKYIHFLKKKNGLIICKIDFRSKHLKHLINVLIKYSEVEIINNNEKIIPNLDFFSIFFIILDIKDISSILTEIKKIQETNDEKIYFIDTKFKKYIGYNISKIELIQDNLKQLQNIERLQYEVYLFIYQYYLKNDYYFMIFNNDLISSDKLLYNQFLLNNIFTPQFYHPIEDFSKMLISTITKNNCKCILEISNFENVILQLYLLKALFTLDKLEKSDFKFYTIVKYKDLLINKQILLKKYNLQHLLYNENIINELYFLQKEYFELIYFNNVPMDKKNNLILIKRCISILKVNGFIIIYFNNIDEKYKFYQYLYLQFYQSLDFKLYKSKNENLFDTFIILKKKKHIKKEIPKIAYLFLTTQQIHRKDFWNNYFSNDNLINVYYHNDKNNDEENNQFYIIPNTKKTKWGFILEAYFLLFEKSIIDENNKFFVICSETCIPILPFQKLYDLLVKTNKNFIEIWNMDKNSYSKIEKINKNKNHIKHSAFWILKRSIIIEIIKNKKHILENYSFESGEEYFLSNYYNKYSKDFINKQTTYTDWKYNKSKIHELYLKKKKVKTDHEYLLIKKEIAELGNHPKLFIDNIPEFIFKKDIFFARKFKLSTTQLILNNYIFDKVFVISGFQNIRNNIILEIFLHCFEDDVMLINQIPSVHIDNIFNINIFEHLIFKEHYLGKPFDNLISIKNLTKRKIKYLIFFTDNYSIETINYLYQSIALNKYSIQKIFILNDILNIIYNKIIYDEDIKMTKKIIFEWLSYFELSRKKKNIILINYNQFLNYKFDYICSIFSKLNLKTSFNINFDFNVKLDLYKKYLDNDLISYVLKNFYILFILQKYFNGKEFIDSNILLLTNYSKISFLFYLNNILQLKPYWDIFYSNNLSSSYMFINNNNVKNRIKERIFSNTILLEKNNLDNTILSNFFELFKVSITDKNNKFFIFINEAYIPSIAFHDLYEILSRNKKNYIDILKVESKNKIIYHSPLFILTQKSLQNIISNEQYIKNNFNENTFLSYLYFKNKNDFITSNAFFTYPKKQVDIVPVNIFEKNHFFTGPFLLSNDKLFLKDYTFDSIFIVSGLQRSGNHMFIKLIIESLPERVLFINDINVRHINYLFDINSHNGFIYDGHYLSKNISNLVQNKDLNKKKFKFLLISTEEFTIDKLELFYDYLNKNHKYFKKLFKIFIQRDILNLAASRIQFQNKHKGIGFPMYVDDAFCKTWYNYFHYSKNKNIITLNYNLFITQKQSYITEQLSLINITYNKNIILEQTLFGDGSSFHNKNNEYLRRYILFKHNFNIKKILYNSNVIDILHNHFAGKYYL